MTRTRVDDDGNVSTDEIRADDQGNGKLYLAVDADIERGDEVSYTLPNGKTRTMKVTAHDVVRAARGSSLDHTVCKYEVVPAMPLQRPTRVNLPDLHERVSDAGGAQFADGHYDEAVFNAFKAVEDRVKSLTGSVLSGKPLMANVFNEQGPALDIASKHAQGQQGADEAEGYKFLFMGASLGLRNPRGHGGPMHSDAQEAMEMLAAASLLMRALDRAEKRLPQQRQKPPIQNLPPGIGGAMSRG